MNYYPHHIGDFNNATRHLTRVERSLYRDLIEHYYDTEAPLPDDFDRLARRVIASSPAEIDGLKYILGEYFHLVDGLYIHHRCDEEIAKYRANTTAKAKAGKASAAARKAKKEQKGTPVEQPLNECATNQEPITTNQEPSKDYIAFELFYDIYPKKVDKADAKKVWNRLKPDQALFDIIRDSISRQLGSGNWSLSEKNYIPGPAKYLRQEKWNDEIIPRGNNNGQSGYQQSNQPISEVERVNQAISRRAARRQQDISDSGGVIDGPGNTLEAP